MSETKKLWRTASTYTARNVRIMSISEPKQINDEVTLVSFSFVDQSGNEKDPDTWVRVTGANGLAERIYNSKVGDRVNVSGKPTFRAYVNKEGEPVASVELKFTDYVDFLTPAAKDGATETTAEETEKEEVVEEVEEAPKRRGRPPGKKADGKTLPFGD